MASSAPEEDSVKPQRARRRKAVGQEVQSELFNKWSLSSVRTDSSTSATLVHSETALSDKSPAVNDPKPKRGRSKKAVIEAAKLSPDEKASPEDPSTEPQEKPKRSRQKRTLVVEEEAQSMLLDPSSTAYALSLKKPHKPRSKAARIDTPIPEDDGECEHSRSTTEVMFSQNLNSL
jgi:hypothetical protein